MKKLILLLSCMVLLFVGIPSKYTTLSRLDIKGTYQLYIVDNPTPIEVDMDSASTVLAQYPHVSAECIATHYDVDTLCYLKNTLKTIIVGEECVEGRQIIYAYSNKLKDSITVGGQMCNIQIVIHEDSMLIGYPIIYGGY